MKWLLLSITLLALVCLSCTKITNNTVVGNTFTPTITRFSPDTAWTFKTDTIFGTNFGYANDGVLVWIDTVLATYVDAEDTMLIVTVPEGARTGLIKVWSYEQTATSAKPVVIDYTFNPHSINDTLPDGASFSIPGTGMNNAGNSLRMVVGAIQFHIDSVFPDRIVSHVPVNTPSGNVYISDSGYNYGSADNIGALSVTRPSAWTTLSQIYNYITVTETHNRSGYTNGPVNTIDSNWTTTASYAGQHDTNVTGLKFVRTTSGLQCTVGPYQITWDTVTASPTAEVTFNKYSSIPTTPTHSLDTQWYAGYTSLPASLPVDNDIQFVLPNFRYQITEDSSDTQGLVNWTETTSTQVTSGSYEIIFKH